VKVTKFQDLVDKKVKFYGVCDTCFKINNTIFQAVEDPADGYRSYLGSVELESDVKNLIFFRKSIVDVTIKDSYIGYQFVDDSGHCWLQFGTEAANDYYPYFVFRYTPKKS